MRFPWENETGCSPPPRSAPDGWVSSRACWSPAGCTAWNPIPNWSTSCSASASIRPSASANSPHECGTRSSLTTPCPPPSGTTSTTHLHTDSQATSTAQIARLPCYFPTESVDANGRVRKQYRYQDLTTPYEKLKSLPEAAQFFAPGVTFEQLDAFALELSDNQAAEQLNKARERLFRRGSRRRSSPGAC